MIENGGLQLSLLDPPSGISGLQAALLVRTRVIAYPAMNAKINWTNHLIELAVVFVGITAAFMLENWREHRKERQSERKYLDSFFDDLTADAEVLRAIIPSNQAKLERAARFLWVEMKTPGWPLDSAAAMLANMMTVDPFQRKKSTYESVKNSGSLGVLSDYAMRQEIVLYYDSFEEVGTKEKLYFDWLNAYVMPFINNNVDLVTQRILSEPAVRSPMFKNLLVGYYALLQQNLETYKHMNQMNAGVLAKISQHLTR